MGDDPADQPAHDAYCRVFGANAVDGAVNAGGSPAGGDRALREEKRQLHAQLKQNSTISAFQVTVIRAALGQACAAQTSVPQGSSSEDSPLSPGKSSPIAVSQAEFPPFFPRQAPKA